MTPRGAETDVAALTEAARRCRLAVAAHSHPQSSSARSFVEAATSFDHWAERGAGRWPDLYREMVQVARALLGGAP